MNGCGRTCYPTLEHAEWALRMVRSRGGKAWRPSTTEYCRECKGWHLA